jgi:hypothetical protein
MTQLQTRHRIRHPRDSFNALHGAMASVRCRIERLDRRGGYESLEPLAQEADDVTKQLERLRDRMDHSR